MDFLGFKVLTINVKEHGNVKILSISELPKDRLFLLQMADTPMEMLEKSFELVELALLNPSQSDIFKNMTPSEFFSFYREWNYKSRELDEELRQQKAWEDAEED